MDLLRLIVALLRHGGIGYMRKHGANLLDAIEDAGVIAAKLRADGVLAPPKTHPPPLPEDVKAGNELADRIERVKYPTPDTHAP